MLFRVIISQGAEEQPLPRPLPGGGRHDKLHDALKRRLQAEQAEGNPDGHACR